MGEKTMQQMATYSTVHTKATAMSDDLLRQVFDGSPHGQRLARALQVYLLDEYRPRLLVLRRYAHNRIRRLLAPGRLAQMSLKDFHQRVWRMGEIGYAGQHFRNDSPPARQLLTPYSILNLVQAIQKNQIVFTGNQTWNASQSVIAPHLGEDDPRRRQSTIEALQLLLYGPGPESWRMQQLLDAPYGLDLTAITGILHAMDPARHIPFSAMGVALLQRRGVTLSPVKIEDYLLYLDFAQALKNSHGLASLTDVDWFMHQQQEYMELGSALGG
jgi:hypothetical protein